MKKIYLSLVAVTLFLVMASQLRAQTYCYPTWTYACTNYYMSIVNFSTTGAYSPQISNLAIGADGLGKGCGDNLDNNNSYFPNQTCKGIPGSVINFSFTTGPNYSENVRVWVDWNQDGTYNATDEMVYSATNISTNSTVNNSFTIPLNAPIGHSRIRIISTYYGVTLPATIPCTPTYTIPYGELQEYSIYVLTNITAPPLSGFAYNINTDTVWVNNPYVFVNTTNNGQHYYWDITGYSSTFNGTYTPYTPPASNPRACIARWNNTCYLDTIDQNFTWRFPQPGYYKVKLKATNIAAINGVNADGLDSITKIIVCAYPSQKPTASFFSVLTTVGFTDQLYYYDLSTNGPTAWSWFLNPTYRGVNTYSNTGFPNAFYDALGNPIDTTTQNPSLYAFDGGVFDVCLAVGNAMGWDTLCRHNYLTVNNGYMMCNGTDSLSTLTSGYVYDQGGPGGNYTGLTTGNCPAGFLISACADTIILDVERFKLAAGDSLIITQSNAQGPVVKKLFGASIPSNSRHIKVPGGDVFFQMTTVSGSPGDSGFAIRWSIIPASYGKPKASFTFTTNGPTTNGVSTVYKGYTIKYRNTSTGIHMGYSWDSNGDHIFGSISGGDSINANPSWTPSTPGNYRICLVVYNCIGQDSACHSIKVLPVPGKPIADIGVNKTFGFTTDTFRFFDQSSNGATSWHWSFNPTNISYIGGTNAFSQNPILFLNSNTCYTVTLTSTNLLGSDTKLAPCLVNVLGYNSPGTAFTIPAGSDIGISRVKLGTIDTTTALQSPTFTQMNDLQKTILYRGVDYTVTTYRITNNDPMTTKVWMDLNMNASFTDPGETIINEKSQYKIATSKTFRIPDNNQIGNARMRVGITYDSTTLTPNMSQLGCFEDYGIYIGVDYVSPTISLKGPSVYKMQVGKTYTEYGVTGIDNLEGDISSRFVRTGNLDVNTVGYYTLTYTVSDLYGNTSSPINRVVQVEINQSGPTLALIGKDTVKVGVKYQYTEQGATAKDNLGNDISSLVYISGNVNTNVLGTYTVNYTITDAFGFSVTKIRTVNVVDTTKPVIVSINGKYSTDTVRSQIGTPFNYQNFLHATDNYTSDLLLTQTGKINVNVAGYYILLFTTTDGSGNTSTTYRLVVKIDNTYLPYVNLIDLSYLTVDVNTVFTDPNVTYSSPYYAWGTLVETITSNLDMTKLGTYNINYCVTDPSSNSTCISRTVQVVDRIAPVITLIGDDPYILPRYKAYVDPGVIITDNYYTEATLKTLNTCFKPDYSKVKNDVPGIYYVSFNDIDPSGNIANTVIRTVKVQDMFGGINTVSAANKMKIYPNPNNGKFTVEIDNGTAIHSINVYSIIGSLVKTIQVNTNSKNIEIDMSDASEGIYIVKIDSQDGSYTQKVNIVR